ncbi:MAG: DUF1573 domain-containing protein [Flavobacteriales bacterium]
MKQIIIAAAMAISMVTQAQTEVVSGPVISIVNDTNDFGSIEYKGDGTCTFIVTNTGSEPLIISECKKSCGCTTPTCPNTPIMPGESTTITLKYDTSRVGPFSKSVTVTSNAVNEPVKVLHIKGTVKPDSSTTKEQSPAKTAAGPVNGK